MIQIVILQLFLLLSGCIASVASVEKAESKSINKPNIIIILADDQGWGSTSVQMAENNPLSASDFVRTPNLESLAKRGVVFSNGYAAHPNCSPTRASIQTGKTPAQLRMTDIVDRHNGPFFKGNKLIPPYHVYGLPNEEITYAELIKSNLPDYRTAHFGKWHLAAGGPQAHGFDASDGATTNSEGNHNIEDNPKDIFGITNRGINWMREQVESGHPFVMQLSHYATHLGMEARPETIEKVSNYPPGTRHDLVKFAAMAEDLDKGLGMVLDEIKKLGIEDNTYVIYLADNGTYPTTNPENINGPLHGWKATLWEGGIRVPFIVSGPGIKHRYSTTPVTSCDIYPTICDWLNINEMPVGLDGGSLAPNILDSNKKVHRENDYQVFYFPHYQHQKGTHPGVAVIKDNYKLIKYYEDNSEYLFDMDKDPQELNNIANLNQKILEELNRDIDGYFETHDIQLPTLNTDYDISNDPGRNYFGIKAQLLKESYFIVK
ncbi:sulfatase [Draconibacterium sediminis]|uniref:sulfatase n=1 Tax=Draconibacterium sediminis TaxID=1544798 RepID=UPI0009E19EF6|nr:sulfatase [Draconibacterium sediminis]